MPELLQQQLTWTNAAIMFAWAVVILMVVLGFVTYAIYFERKVIGWMQLRIGPNRTGPLGLLQSVADVLKLLLKEDTIPKKKPSANSLFSLRSSRLFLRLWLLRLYRLPNDGSVRI